MKQFFILLSILCVAPVVSSQKISVMTYNIRYDNPEDSANSWSNRKALLSSQIKFNHPDIIGIQEALNHQLSFVDSVINDYNFVGVGRDDGQTKGEYNAIFYDVDKFNLLEQGTFWLSETPDSVSVGWDAALPRICTYALLHHRSYDQDIWVFNTHFDHLGEEARAYSAQLIMQKLDTLNSNRNIPVVIMGDFNETFDEFDPGPFVNSRLTDSKIACMQPPYGPSGTFNGFEYVSPATQRIDYIFVSEQIDVIKYGVLTASQEGRFPSDHFPVYIEIELMEN